MISGIIKVKVNVKLTLTSTFIIRGITKTKSNNCFLYIVSKKITKNALCWRNELNTNQISCCKGKWYVRRFDPDTVDNGHIYSSVKEEEVLVYWVYLDICSGLGWGFCGQVWYHLEMVHCMHNILIIQPSGYSRAKKMAAHAHQIFWKDSLRSTKILVCGHKMYQLLQNTLAPVNCFWLDILKGTTKACPVNLLMLNTPRGTKTAFLTPKTEIINHIVI